jgi:hypothetical protein
MRIRPFTSTGLTRSHQRAEDLSRRVAAFETHLNHDAGADRLWVNDCLDLDEEKLRFSRWRGLVHKKQFLR